VQSLRQRNLEGACNRRVLHALVEAIRDESSTRSTSNGSGRRLAYRSAPCSLRTDDVSRGASSELREAVSTV
jgi:hypothetical protein